jgi:hypothetical protein
VGEAAKVAGVAVEVAATEAIGVCHVARITAAADLRWRTSAPRRGHELPQVRYMPSKPSDIALARRGGPWRRSRAAPHTGSAVRQKP